jgi:hypothetical protein
MSEQNRRNNWPQTISPEVPEEMLRVPISVIAPALVWIRVWGAREYRLFQGHKGRHRCRGQIEIMDVIFQPDV